MHALFTTIWSLLVLKPVRSLLLAGHCDGGMKLVVISTSKAYTFFKHKQVVQIKGDCQEEFIQALGMAKVWCRDNMHDPEAHVSILNDGTRASFAILYRQKETLPPVVSLKAIIPNYSHTQNVLTFIDIENIIKKYCKQHGFFLQSQSLKSDARYSKCVHLEECLIK